MRRDLSGRRDPIVSSIDRRNRRDAARDLLAKRISAIGIVLDAESIQRPGDEEFRLSVKEVSDRSGIPLYAVRILGRDHFAMVRVPGRVTGFDRGFFYVADDEAAHRRRHPECYEPARVDDVLARADSIGNLGGYWDGECYVVADA